MSNANKAADIIDLAAFKATLDVRQRRFFDAWQNLRECQMQAALTASGTTLSHLSAMLSEVVATQGVR